MKERLMNWRRFACVLPLLCIALLLQQAAHAQDSYAYPEDLFYELLDEQELSLDEAREIVAIEFDDYDAAEIAAYLCAPEADVACAGSYVWEVWSVFLNELYIGKSVNDILIDLLDVDEFLAFAIADYWCSPPAGAGCEGDTAEEDDYEYSQRESFFSEDVANKARPESERPASTDAEAGAQFFGGKKRCSRTRGRRC